MSELWIVEYRSRRRKNSRWSEWAALDHREVVTAYLEYPAHRVFADAQYETRAVKFNRAEEDK